jgi:WhiB family redox-sensing transcriptional regulator
MSAYTDGTSTDRPNSWQQQGECARMVDGQPVYDPEWWFPIGNTGPAVAQIEWAAGVCNQLCQVRETCLNFALDHNISDGVWGGHSEDERTSMRRRIVRQARVDRGHSTRKPPDAPHVREPEQFTEAAAVRRVLAAAVGAGFTARDISRRTGISESTVKEILTGRRASVTRATAELVEAAGLGAGVSA